MLRRLDGYLFGDHRGVFYGPSLDLAEVREYQPGDEVRRIDWNVTARTGTVHVRLFREEREVLAWLLVDGSGSMGFGTRRVSKLELAREFAAVVAAVMARKGKIGALTMSRAGATLTPPAAGRKQTLRILEALGASPPARPRAGADLTAMLDLANRTMRRRGLVFVVSDFLDDGPRTGAAPDWQKPLTRLALVHDVIAVRVRDPAERSLPAAGELRVRDLESGSEVWLDTDDPKVRSAYAELAGRRDEAVTRALRSARVDVLDLSTEHDVVDPVLRFAALRQARRA